MRYDISPELRTQLEKDGHPAAEAGVVEIKDSDFVLHLRNVQGRPENERRDAAAYRCLTWGWKAKPPVVQSAPSPVAPVSTVETSRPIVIDLKELDATIGKWGRRVLFGIGVIALILIASALAHAQNVNPAIVVATCGTPPAVYPSANGRAPETVDTNGNLCAGVTVSATVNTAGLAISFGASTSGGNTGPAYPAAVYSTAAAPSYTEGKFNALSSDLAGGLRVNATVTPAANATTNITQVDGAAVPNAGSGALAVVGITSSGTTAIGGPVLIGGLNGTASQSVQAIPVGGGGALAVVLAGTSGTGTIGNVTLSGTPAVTLANTAGSPAIVSIQSQGVGVGIISSTNAQKSDISSIAGTATATGAGVSGSNTQRVSVANDSFTAGAPAIVSIQTNGVGVGIISATNGLKTDMSSIAGTATVTAGVSGLQAIGGAAASGATLSGNPVVVAASTGGNAITLNATTGGTLLTSLPIIARTPYMNTALGAAVTVANLSAVILDSVSCMNSSTTANAFVQIFNTTAPSVTLGTTVPMEQYMVPFGGGFVMTNMHTLYPNGIAAASTTVATGSSTQAALCTIKTWVQ